MTDILDADPLDYLDEYSEWLMTQDLNICNGDDLIKHVEAGTRFIEFMEARNGRLAK